MLYFHVMCNPTVSSIRSAFLVAFALLCAAQGQIIPFPNYHFSADLGRLYNQQSEFFEERYFVESDIYLDFDFLSIRDRVTIASEFYVHSGMGKTYEDVVFDPKDFSLGFDPLVKIHFSALTAQVGLIHHCYHEIDRRDFTAVYYNRLYLGAASANYHPLVQINDVAQGGGLPALERFAWQVRSGFFLREFFDLVRPTSVSYHNNYLWETNWALRYVGYRYGPLFLSGRIDGVVGYWDKSQSSKMDNAQWYYKTVFAFEPGWVWARSGGVISLSYTRDHLPRFYSHTREQFYPRFSRDRIIKLALRLFM